MGLNYLSKSKFMRGRECPRLLWYEINQPNALPPIDAATQAIFDMGHEVGKLAKELYPDGLEIKWGKGYLQAVQNTQEALKQRRPIFEATFISEIGGIFLLARTDILVPVNTDKWDIIEVKSSKSVNEERYPYDVAFQVKVLLGCGINVRNSYLMHLNPDYRRRGTVRPEDVLIKEEMDSRISLLLDQIEPTAVGLYSMLSNPSPPNIDLLTECQKIKGCDLSHLCWEWLPDDHVGHLYSAKADKKMDLISKGTLKLADIPDYFPLTNKQEIQRTAAKTGKPHIDVDSIIEFLNRIEYPVYYLDFETLSTAVPLFDGMEPWGILPFQYSLHLQKEPNGELMHHSFLADLENGKRDPRPDILTGLNNCLGECGSIVVYNESFEKNRLREMANAFPEYQDWLNDNVMPRIIDLIKPFRSFAYYNPSQRGSASIKSVLPALTGSGYENLEIHDGQIASAMYWNISFHCTYHIEIARIRKELEEYCGLDTKGEALIVDRLRSIV